MLGRRHSDLVRSVAIEVCDRSLYLVIYQKQGDGESATVETMALRWRHKSTSLHYDDGRDELAAALKQVVAKYKLHGLPVYLALNGDYCVTRVVTGEEHRVRHELAELEHRSALYLSLGHGRKALGGSVRQIDARHQHALLTVVNQKTLDALVDVARRAGVLLERVEPSLVSLCRLVGRMGGDTDDPSLIVNIGQRGVELGITHRGQPLLDYRPAGIKSHQQVAELVGSHLGRLQRYCDRYVRLTEGSLSKLFLCGEAEAVHEIKRAFDDQDKIDAYLLDPTKIEQSWKFSDLDAGPEFSAALGACLLGADPSLSLPGPNLLERLEGNVNASGLSLLIRAFWPLAASLLLASLAGGGCWYEYGQCHKMERQSAALELPRQKARLLQDMIVRDQTKTNHLVNIESKLINPRWHQIALDVAHCLPDDVWLDTINIDNRGQITVSGVSYNEDGIFELVRWLREYPGIDRVALNGTQTTRLPSGPATRFDVVCALYGS